jgi:hypothetical protein
MTTRLLTIICLFLQTFLNSQTDSVLYWHDKKLISTHEIVLIDNTRTTVESYTFFKGRYWFKSIDTLPQGHFQRLFADTLKKKYLKFHKCDSLRINRIRNEASFFRADNMIEKKARNKIGWDFRECDLNWNRNFHIRTCHDDYLKWENLAINNSYSCIDSIYNYKVQRLKNISNNLSLLTPSFIDTFLIKYSASDPDAHLLSLIILNKTDAFVNSFNKMSESKFHWFTLLLDQFPKDIDTASLKKTVKGHQSKGQRKRKVIKKIKTTRANSN